MTLSMAAIALNSCGGCNSRPIGAAHAHAADPMATPPSSVSRVGQAMSASSTGAPALGDSSIDAAKRNGGISIVSGADVKHRNVPDIITSCPCGTRELI